MGELISSGVREQETAQVHLRRFLGGRLAPRKGAEPALHWADEDRYYVGSTASGDQFIHRDLGGWLRRELDDYISTHLLRPVDIAALALPELEARLAVVRAFRTFAEAEINRLAIAEERRKRQWLRKPLVRACSYLISLARVPESLYAEIAANSAQRAAWVRLFALDELLDAAQPMTIEFLRAHPGLVVDTALFPAEFAARLLAALLGNFDDAIDGILIKGDNFHALSLLSRRFAGAIDCAYIDPPYNTGGRAFAYKDSFRRSAWLSLMDTRLAAFLPLASPRAALFVSIDDNEVGNLCGLMRRRVPDSELVSLIAVQSNPRGRMMDKYLAKTHEYVAAFAVHGDGGAIRPIEKDHAALAEYDRVDGRGRHRLIELRNRNPAFHRGNRPNLCFPLYARPADGAVALERSTEHTIEIWPRNSRGRDCCWRWSPPKVAEQLDLLVAREVRTGGWRVFAKDYLHNHDGQVATTKAKSIWLGGEFNNELGKEALHDLLGAHGFDFPKPPALVAQCARLGMDADGWCIDFFAGSGTSGQALLELNRQGGRRRFILVEHGPQFDDVLVPRLMKVAYSPDWKLGRPLRRDGHIGVMFKCLQLAEPPDELELPEDARIETFNWLLGLRVERVIPPELDSMGQVAIQSLTGWMPGETGPLRVLVIWQTVTGDTERDAARLTAWFDRLAPDLRRACDRVYVNGPSVLEGLRQPGEGWVVVDIEAVIEGLRQGPDLP